MIVLSLEFEKFMNINVGTGRNIGHEFGHAFDHTSRHLDKDGKKYLTWSSKVNERFVQRAQCLIEQYNEYEVSQISRKVCCFFITSKKDLSIIQ